MHIASGQYDMVNEYDKKILSYICGLGGIAPDRVHGDVRNSAAAGYVRCRSEQFDQSGSGRMH